MIEYDVVIIGAGPSGSVAAAYLNKKGFKTLVLEKLTMPRFVIGESLLPRCLDDLEEAGLLDVVEQQNFQIKTGATFHSGDNKLAFDFSDRWLDGPHKYAWQVKRAEFDKVLINEAEKQGVEVRYECTVTNVETSEEVQKVTYVDKASETHIIPTKFIIDASGYGRVIPNLFDLSLPSDLVNRGSIFTHVKDINRTIEAGENIFVHAFKNNSAWLWAIPFNDGETSIGVVGENDFIEELSQDNGAPFMKFMSEFKDLKGRFTGVTPTFDPQKILGYSVGIKQMHGTGYVLAGNTTEFLDPIFSSGVTLATATGLIAAKLTEKQLSGNTVNWQKEYDDVVMHGVEVFRSYVNGWYDGTLQSIIFAPKINPEFKLQICSVLAGYVWDDTNAFIKKHKTILKTLSKVINMNK